MTKCKCKCNTHTHTLYTRGCMQARAHMCTPTELCRDLHTLTYTHIHIRPFAQPLVQESLIPTQSLLISRDISDTTHTHTHTHTHTLSHTHTHTDTHRQREREKTHTHKDVWWGMPILPSQK